MRILLTTTSYQDTPGAHHKLLADSGYEVVRARGPLKEAQLLEIINAPGGGFDALLNGDDIITAKVIDALLPRLKVISKYGIGVDSIDVEHATKHKIPVLFCPGVNHTTVAEHVFGLMVGLAKHFWPHVSSVKKGEWKRVTGTELFGKTIGVLGMGRVGKEVLLRGKAFGMTPIAYDIFWDDKFAAELGVKRCATAEDVLKEAHVVSLHMNLTKENEGFINAQRIELMPKGAILINTARGGLVVEADLAAACKSGRLGGYGADVLDVEPIQAPHPFMQIDNILITPHVGSRTGESVQRQALMSTENLILSLSGKKPLAQFNKF